jgi:hypothetical protein
VLVLGDSFTVGIYPEDAVAGRLGQYLNAVAGGRFEVVNCAVSSFSPLLYYLRLKHQLAALEPDEIVLNLDLTDVYDDYWRYRPLYRFASDGEPVEMRTFPRFYKRFMAAATERSYLARLVHYSRQMFLQWEARGERSEREIFRYHSGLPRGSEEWENAMDFCLQNTARITRFCRERGIVLTITTYPHRQQLEPDSSGRVWHREFEHRVEALCQKEGPVSIRPSMRSPKRSGRDSPYIWRATCTFRLRGKRCGRPIWQITSALPSWGAIGRSPYRIENFP